MCLLSLCLALDLSVCLLVILMFGMGFVCLSGCWTYVGHGVCLFVCRPYVWLGVCLFIVLMFGMGFVSLSGCLTCLWRVGLFATSKAE